MCFLLSQFSISGCCSYFCVTDHPQLSGVNKMCYAERFFVSGVHTGHMGMVCFCRIMPEASVVIKMMRSEFNG